MEITVFILIVIGVFVCHTLSTSYNERIEEKYCEGCINWLWSAVTAVLFVTSILTVGENAFSLFLLLTLGVAVLSAWLCYKKMTGWGATPREAKLGSIAQVASAVGIAAAIILILLLLFGGSKKKRRRR